MARVNIEEDFVINPCPYHNYEGGASYAANREATHICIDDKMAICDDCAITHSQMKYHKIINL
jgi:hypothetical protein